MKKTFLIIVSVALAIIIAINLFSCTKSVSNSQKVQAGITNNSGADSLQPKKKPPCEGCSHQ